jgi:hypothetical protein
LVFGNVGYTGTKKWKSRGEDMTALSRKVVAGSVVAGSREREGEIGSG